MRPYSEVLRVRAVQRAEAGETMRSIAAALRISPSCVPKWRKRRRETVALTPGQRGGHKPRTRSGGPEPSFGQKLLVLTQASSSVPSTEKCSLVTRA